jgi:hypothetical protein
VKHGSIALLVVGCFATGFAACVFDDPDYSSTEFSCDEIHACPPGQTCNGGHCTEGTSGPGVFCGIAGVCVAGTKCCTNPPAEPACIAIAEACGVSAAACDQSSDCGADTCCDPDDTGPTCMAGQCDLRACTGDGDCGGTSPNCCRFDPTKPWGYCYAIECL